MTAREGLPIFNGKDFPVWKMVVEQYLRSKKLDIYLTNEAKPGEPAAVAAENEALSYITRSLDIKQARLVLSCKTAQTAWAKLCQVHDQKSEASKIGVQRQFFASKMERDESVAEYVSRVEYLRAQLQDVGVPIAEAATVAKIVSGLPSSYRSFTTLWSSTDAAQQRISVLLCKLMEEEALQASYRRVPGEAVAFYANTTGKKPFKPKSNGRNINNKRQNKGPDKGKPRNGNCYNCGKEGHFANKCLEKTDKTQGSSSMPRDDKNKWPGPSAAVIAEVNLSQVPSDEWVVDSGATQHMSNDRGSFSSYTELVPNKPIRVGNKSIIYAVGVGDVQILSKLSDGHYRKLVAKNVLYVPDLWRKLFSVGATTLHGNNGAIMGSQLIIRDEKGDELVAANWDGQLFRADMIELPSEADVASNEELNVWHERYGHINHTRLIKMAKEQAVTGLDTIANASIQRDTTRCHINCQSCLIGKQPRIHFGKSTQPKATGVGDRVHIDICGPIAPTTVGGSNYFVLFKDEASSYRHVFFVKSKGEVHDVIRKGVAAYRGELRSPIKTLVSDHGSEFTSNRTQDFLLDQSIHHVMSAPFTPAQNGLIERDNRTVFECARSMIAARRIPHKLWGEAVQVAVYLLNRSINVRNDKTPHEVVFGRKPRVTHLRVFGSLAFMKEPEKKRSGYQKKLDDRARPMLMCGYDRDFTYRLYDLERNIVVLSRDVIFDESSDALQRVKPVNVNTDSERWCPGESFDGFKNYIDDTTDDTDASSDQIQPTEVQASDGNSEVTEIAEYEGNNDIDSSGGDADDSSDRSAYLDAQAIQTPLTTEPSNQDINTRYNLRPRGNARYNLISEAMANSDEPTSVMQALASPEADKWREAMQSEYDSLIANETWTLVKLPSGRRAITAKWIFKIKYKTDGSMDKFKARLVARGFTQQSGIDYQETFSPVVRLESVRVLLAMAAQYKLKMVNFDVKTAYLHGTIKEELYMMQPEGFAEPGGLVCKLRKSIYGLKQAGRCWNTCFTQFLKNFDLVPLRTDHCIFRNKGCNLTRAAVGSIIIALYVDDGLIFTNDTALLDKVLTYLRSKFEITIGDATSYVGLQIERVGDSICVHQSHYIERKASSLGLDQPKMTSTPLNVSVKYCKTGVVGGTPEEPVDVPYRQLIGTLMYAANGTRPDVAYAVCSLSRFNEEPRESHWSAAKRVMRYLAQSTDMRITYKSNSKGLNIVCYSDADHGGDRDDRKSVSGMLILCNGAPIMWRSTKQSKIANSTAVAEFVAAAQASREVVWLRNILTEIGAHQSKPTPMKMDNQTAITLIANNQVHAKTKSLDIDLLTVRDLHGVDIEVSYVQSQEQLADYLTKPIPMHQYNKLLEMSGLVRSRQEKSATRKPALLLSALTTMLLVTMVTARTYRQPLETVIKVHHLCDYFSFGTAPNPMERCDLGWSNYERHSCLRQWVRTEATLVELSKCTTRAIKRSVPDHLEAIAPKITWAAAFNFLLQQGEKVVSGTPFQVAINTFKVISDIAFKRFVTEAGERTKNELESSVSQISETASQHANDTKTAIVLSLNPMESFRKRYMEEVVAANAMLLALYRACRNGHVDTTVLAEMSGQRELLAIKTEDTSVHSIMWSPIDRQLTFVFEAMITESWLREVNWTVVITCIGIVIMLGFFAAAARHFTKQMTEVRKEATKTYEYSRRASSVHEYSLQRVQSYRRMSSFKGMPPPPQPPAPLQHATIEMAELAADCTAPSGGVVIGVPSMGGGDDSAAASQLPVPYQLG